MVSQTNPNVIIFLIGFASISSCGYISDDIVPGYGEVKKLLKAYRVRIAKEYGREYKPENEKIVAETDENSKDYQKSIPEVNRKIWDEVFEGDIILTLPQARYILGESNTPRNKRQLIKKPFSIWPNRTISYEFAETEQTWRQTIRRGLRHIEQNVCIRFKENGGDSDRLKFVKKEGCYSNVGKVGRIQEVSIGSHCLFTKTIAHEVFHALGVFHEQSRYDRDQYITIDTTNIAERTESNFEKQTLETTENLGKLEINSIRSKYEIYFWLTYDYGSAMHYGRKDFAKNSKKDVLIAKDQRYQFTMGNSEGLSFKDARLINLKYCNDICQQRLNCFNGGYTDPNDCNRCRCPSGYGGQFCGAVEPTSCGGALTATNSYKMLQSGPVIAGARCVWRIRSTRQVEVILDYLNFPLLVPPSCYGFVEIKFASDKTITGGRFCDSSSVGLRLQGNDLIVIYYGGESTISGFGGFRLRYREVSGSRLVTNNLKMENMNTVASVQALWSDWGEWSACSQPCGGCGTRTRVRACYEGNQICLGSNLDRQSCNTQVCTEPKKGIICNGRLLLPCDLLAKLKFESNNCLNPKFRFAHHQKWKKIPTVGNLLSSTVRRVKRQTATRLCEKRFTYQCPTALLTIEVEYRETNLNSNLTTSTQYPECCSGYIPKENHCYKY